MDTINLRREEDKARDKVKTIKGKFPALAHDPVFNAEKMQALQLELGEAERAHLLARIATKKAELEELETLMRSL